MIFEQVFILKNGLSTLIFFFIEKPFLTMYLPSFHNVKKIAEVVIVCKSSFKVRPKSSNTYP